MPPSGGGAIRIANEDSDHESRFKNNFFVLNHSPRGTDGLLINADTIVLNNTFWGVSNDSQLNFSERAGGSAVQNNIFYGAGVALYEGTNVFSFPITNNSFYEVNSVLYRGSQSLGNDIAFVELVVDGMSDNVAAAPGFVGTNLDSGIFTGTASTMRSSSIP